MSWQRYGVYWVPNGAFGAMGAAWLGWDMRRAHSLREPRVRAPKARRYGFHATLKAPFRLAEGQTEEALRALLYAVAGGLGEVALGTLRLEKTGGFLALRPEETEGISEVAARLVQSLDPFRAPSAPEDLARRRAAGLSARQADLLESWGYPYVLDEFRPHLTLSDGDTSDDTEAMAARHFEDILARPMSMSHVSLVAEDTLGRFHLLEDVALGRHALDPQSAA